jgi:hypothetical protein
MPRGSPFVHVVPFVPPVVGVALSVWRFRCEDPLGGIAAAIAGLLGTVVVVFLIPETA